MVVSTAGSPEPLAGIAQQLVGKAFASGMFLFADADLKCDQPQTEWCSTGTSCGRRASTSGRPDKISRRCWAATTSTAGNKGAATR
jgi:hypothetical protein